MRELAVLLFLASLVVNCLYQPPEENAEVVAEPLLELEPECAQFSLRKMAKSSHAIEAVFANGCDRELLLGPILRPHYWWEEGADPGHLVRLKLEIYGLDDSPVTLLGRPPTGKLVIPGPRELLRLSKGDEKVWSIDLCSGWFAHLFPSPGRYRVEATADSALGSWMQTTMDPRYAAMKDTFSELTTLEGKFDADVLFVDLQAVPVC